MLVLIVAYLWPGNEPKYPPGVLVTEEPSQTLIQRPTPWDAKGYRITPLADFRLHGRVLLTDRYFLGREADLSPLDLTVGWRQLSDQAVIDRMVLLRERRAFSFRPKGNEWPVSAGDVTRQTANLHTIPANDEVLHTLRNVQRGNLIELSGYLVKVEAPDGWHWRSSLSRNDTGPGACELVWIERLVVR